VILQPTLQDGKEGEKVRSKKVRGNSVIILQPANNLRFPYAVILQ